MEPIVSVIIPVFNVERYLRRCLESVIAQTYSNLQIICIDDGSSDRSGEICNEFARLDGRVQVFHQKNCGVSEARNKGLDLAKGEYISFVDSDDYIEKNMLELMVQVLEKGGADICVAQWQYEFVDGRRVIDNRKINPHIYGKKSSFEFERFLYKGSYENSTVVVVWNKLYRRSIIGDIRFEGRIQEDEIFNDKINAKDCKMEIIEDQLYIYSQNKKSLTNQPFSASAISFLDVLVTRRKLFQNDSYIREKTERLYCNMLLEYCVKAYTEKVRLPQIDRYYDELRKMYKSLCCEGKTDMKFRARIRLFLMFPELYCRIMSRRQAYPINDLY